MNFLKTYTRIFSLLILLLLFLGALVKSNDAGLAVPDWPTTFGENMFTFPVSKWVGGVFFEHFHRLFASFVGFCTIILVIAVFVCDKRKLPRVLSTLALATVILQGILGGLTVLFKLPDAISISHGLLAQTFFLLSVLILIIYTDKFIQVSNFKFDLNNSVLGKLSLFCFVLTFIQLFLGALVRHTESGLAIPDFPAMGGSLLPQFNEQMLATINQTRLDLGLRSVTMSQVIIHFFHRLWAVFILAADLFLIFRIDQTASQDKSVLKFIKPLGLLLLFQILLGVITVLSVRDPLITSAHLLIGALLLAVNFSVFIYATLGGKPATVK